MKGLEPEDSTELEPFWKTEAGLSAVDDAGEKRPGFRDAGAGEVPAGVSVSSFAYVGFENMDEAEEVDAKADDEGPAGLKDEIAGLPAASG